MLADLLDKAEKEANEKIDVLKADIGKSHCNSSQAHQGNCGT